MITKKEFKEKLDELLKEVTGADAIIFTPEQYGDIVATIINLSKE